MDIEATIQAVWKSQGLEELEGQVGLGETITPTMMGVATEPDALRVHEGAVLTLPELPHIELGQPEAGVVADLELLGALGEGGMGRVLLAQQHSLKRDVAIKTTLVGARKEAASAIFSEALVMGHLEHPNIIPVHALGVDEGGQPVLVMKRVSGVSWLELIQDRDHEHWSVLTPSGDHLQAHLNILVQICNALHFAHTRGIIHRDIKPENVMVGAFGEVYLLDWGIATKSDRQSGQLVGTLSYMAPEMAMCQPVNARTDVFLLGAVLYEVLGGTPPWQGDSLYTVLLKIGLYDLAELDEALPLELVEICKRAIARQPEDRYENAQVLRQAISTYLSHRASFEITRTAHERLKELEATVTSEGKAREVYSLHAEAVFGFRLALREWSGNRDAQKGLDESTRHMARFELRARNFEAAEARVAELHEPGAEFLDALEKLRLEMDQEAARQHDLARLAEQFDVSVGRRARFAFLAVFTVLLAGISFYVVGMLNEEELTYPFLLILAAGTLAFFTGLVFLFRKHVANTGLNRRLVIVFLLCIVGIFLNRLMCWRLGVPPTHVFALDMVMVLVVSACIAMAIYPMLWTVTAFFGLGIVLVLIDTDWLLPVFAAMIPLSIGATAGLSLYLQPKSPPGEKRDETTP